MKVKLVIKKMLLIVAYCFITQMIGRFFADMFNSRIPSYVASFIYGLIVYYILYIYIYGRNPKQ